MRANAHDKGVLVAPVDGVLDVKITRREAAVVFSELVAVQPDRRAELGLANLEQGDGSVRRGAECFLIPEIIAVLIDRLFCRTGLFR